MSKCANCGAEFEPGMKFCNQCGKLVPQTKICPECGSEQKPEARFCSSCGHAFGGGEAHGAAADIVSATVGGHAVVAGDVNQTVNNTSYVTNVDESKQVVQCAVCGKGLAKDNTYTCPSCQNKVCSQHYDSEHLMCTVCWDKKRHEAETEFRQTIRDELAAGDGRVDADALERLRQKRQKLGLDAAAGRALLESTRSAWLKDLRPQPEDANGLTDLQRMYIEKARRLAFDEGDCVAAVRYLDVAAKGTESPCEEILSVLMPALLVCDEERGVKIAAECLVDYKAIRLYRFDYAFKHDDLPTAEEHLIELDRFWPDDVLVKCRRVELTCAVAAKCNKAGYRQAADLLSGIDETDDLLERSWRHYVARIVAQGRGEEVPEADQELYRALASGQLAEGRPPAYSETQEFRQEVCDHFDEKGAKTFEHLGVGDFLFDFSVATECVSVLSCVVNLSETLSRYERESAKARDLLQREVPEAIFFRLFVSDQAEEIREKLEDKTIYVASPDDTFDVIEKLLHRGDLEHKWGVVRELADEWKLRYKSGVEINGATADFLLFKDDRCVVASLADAKLLKGAPEISDKDIARMDEVVAALAKSFPKSVLCPLFVIETDDVAKGHGALALDAGCAAYVRCLQRLKNFLRVMFKMPVAKWKGLPSDVYDSVAAVLGFDPNARCETDEAAKRHVLLLQIMKEALTLEQDNNALREEALTAELVALLDEVGLDGQKFVDDAMAGGATLLEVMPEVFRKRGEAYYYGKGVERSYEEAYKCFHDIAEEGDACAQNWLGALYSEGNGVPRSYEEAVKWYRKAADQGNRKAQYNLANLYECGKGVAQSYDEAVKWYRKSAEQGDADAQSNLAWMCLQGLGVAQSDSEAVKWFRKAAEQGNADAQCNLGWMCREGRGVAQSDVEAVKWYQMAVDQDHVGAQCNLASLYEDGKGVAQSYEEAVKWYRKSADQGYARAQGKMGVMYERGWGVSKSYEEAVKWYRKAAEQGLVWAQYNLACCYKNGCGVSQSYAESVAWYRKAADQGLAAAQDWLGVMYYKGFGVPQSYDKAVEWCRKAADQGECAAQYRLGVMYEIGVGVGQSWQRSAQWYEKAARQLPEAQRALGILLLHGLGVDKSIERAVLWLRKAADLGDAHSQYLIGFLYERGRMSGGVSLDEAEQWYRKASARGDGYAQRAINRIMEAKACDGPCLPRLIPIDYVDASGKDRDGEKDYLRSLAVTGPLETAVKMWLDGHYRTALPALMECRQDDPLVCYLLSLLYESEKISNSCGRKTNAALSRQYLERAAALDNPKAMYDLACKFRHEHKKEKAMRWLSAAACRGLDHAIKTIISAYVTGERSGWPVSKDLTEAYKYVQFGVKLKSEFAVRFWAGCVDGSEKWPMRLKDYHQLADVLRQFKDGRMYFNGAYSLGLMWEKGLTGKKDLKMAKFWYEYAVRHAPRLLGGDAAKSRLGSFQFQLKCRLNGVS